MDACCRLDAESSPVPALELLDLVLQVDDPRGVALVHQVAGARLVLALQQALLLLVELVELAVHRGHLEPQLPEARGEGRLVGVGLQARPT